MRLLALLPSAPRSQSWSAGPNPRRCSSPAAGVYGWVI